ncbi:MAG: hypothetical protein U5K00_21420 [Melioribacteraceae bacterium]|nr:hypothetical protein [Melioribacteraceae bacterium]
MSKFKVIKSDILFSGKVFDLKVDEIQYDTTGNTGRREVAVHSGRSCCSCCNRREQNSS